jgi:hypothetical protein
LVAAAAADEQDDAGGDDGELAHLLPHRAPHLVQLLLLLRFLRAAAVDPALAWPGDSSSRVLPSIL